MENGSGRSKVVIATTVAVVVVLVAAVAGFVVLRSSGDAEEVSDRPGVDAADPAVVSADAFARAWMSGDWAGAPLTAGSGDDVADKVKLATAGLTSAAAEPVAVKVTDVVRGTGEDADTARATATVEWVLDGGRRYTYPVSWTLVHQSESARSGAGSTPTSGDPEWLVVFDEAGLLPAHKGGEIIRVSRVAAPRGQILDTTGRSLTAGAGKVTIGIRKSRATDPEATARQAAALAGVDAEALVAKVAAAGPDEFVAVATLDRDAYNKIRAQIRPIPGTVFTEEDVVSDLPDGYARAVLGRTGPATPEMVEASDGRLHEGDITGIGGVQEGQDETLAGSPGLRVEAVATTPGAVARELQSWPAVPGTSVTVTLDEQAQLAAEAAIASTSTPSAVVAIRVSTGDVLAVANGPAGSTGYNRAMVGRYPPGSVFKVVSGLAILERGITPDTTVDCPATIVVGKRFKNAEGEVLGKVSFREDFAHSCNTAFISEARNVSSQQLSETAARMGYRPLDIGVPLFGGSVPVTDSITEHAADMIGQGKVEASPFVVALASASAASGRTLEPRLVVDPAVTPEPGPALPAQPIADLQGLMRRVVTNGTGRAVAGVPGGEVHGKTGTAEFGTESPPQTHAWFTGYQGDVAFAVLVEDGGFGGTVAAPVAADFLTRLANG